MKRILGIAMVLGLVGALTVMIGCSKAKEETVAQEVKSGKIEVVDLGKDVKLEIVLIPAGKFKMGSPAFIKGRSDNERRHEVILTMPFYIGKFEVTQEQWKSVMGQRHIFSRKYTLRPETKNINEEKMPVTGVTWNDCQEFIKKLNTKTNGGYRLPTEAEWEYACRAGARTEFASSDELSPEDANSGDSYFEAGNGNKIGQPVAVGSYKPNAFGLYDMHGNVAEWCEDRYGDYPAGTATDPKGAATGERRVFRGGDYETSINGLRSSYRLGTKPDFEHNTRGFRLARTP